MLYLSTQTHWRVIIDIKEYAVEVPAAVVKGSPRLTFGALTSGGLKRSCSSAVAKYKRKQNYSLVVHFDDVLVPSCCLLLP